jgi:hypothetical protein
MTRDESIGELTAHTVTDEQIRELREEARRKPYDPAPFGCLARMTDFVHARASTRVARRMASRRERGQDGRRMGLASQVSHAIRVRLDDQTAVINHVG